MPKVNDFILTGCFSSGLASRHCCARIFVASTIVRFARVPAPLSARFAWTSFACASMTPARRSELKSMYAVGGRGG